MSTSTALLLLLVAALLEAGGDALVRAGLHSPAPLRFGFLIAGALVLFAYGYTVNATDWDFGRLLGLYIVFFFVVAQLIAWLAFGQKPETGIIAGGGCIILGGLIIAAWRS